MTIVSVIIPAFNAEKTIARSIQSALNQDIDKEIIVIDDASVDNTLEIVNALACKHICIRVIALKANSGPGLCRNIGIESSVGKFIAFLDADDLWLPDKLSVQINFMIYNKLDFSYHDYYHANYKFESLQNVAIVRAPESASLPGFYFRRGYGMCLTSVIKRDAIGEVRFSIDRSISAEDYNFFLKLLIKGVRGIRIDKPMGIYINQISSRSSNKIRQARSVFRVNFGIKSSSRLSLFFYFIIYAIYNIFGIQKFRNKKISNSAFLFLLNEVFLSSASHDTEGVSKIKSLFR